MEGQVKKGGSNSPAHPAKTVGNRKVRMPVQTCIVFVLSDRLVTCRERVKRGAREQRRREYNATGATNA